MSIYIVGFGPYVKIGFTKNFTFRLSILQSYSPETLTIYGCMNWPNSMELLLHRRFKHHHLRGEWFRKEGELAGWIADGCPSLTPAQLAATREGIRNNRKVVRLSARLKQRERRLEHQKRKFFGQQIIR